MDYQGKRLTAKELRDWIDERFRFHRDFIDEFNSFTKYNSLHSDTLSRQLAGTINISKGYDAAYKLFMQIYDSK